MAVEALARVVWSQSKATEAGCGGSATTAVLCLLFDNLMHIRTALFDKMATPLSLSVAAKRVSLLALGCSPGHREGPDGSQTRQLALGE